MSAATNSGITGTCFLDGTVGEQVCLVKFSKGAINNIANASTVVSGVKTDANGNLVVGSSASDAQLAFGIINQTIGTFGGLLGLFL